jgi:hypothetical protein
LAITWPRGPIDWPHLARRHRGLVLKYSDALIDFYRGRAVYLAGAISHYVEIGQRDIPINHALEWQAVLLAHGVSPISPVLLTEAAMMLRPQDEITAALNTMPRDWWLRRCQPWLAASAAMVVTPYSGWAASDGIWAEANWMVERKRPVLVPEMPQ